MSDQHRAKTALDIAVKHGFKFTTYEDGTTDYCDESGFVDDPEDLAGSIAEFFDQRLSTAVEGLIHAEHSLSEAIKVFELIGDDVSALVMKGHHQIINSALQSIKGNSDE